MLKRKRKRRLSPAGQARLIIRETQLCSLQCRAGMPRNSCQPKLLSYSQLLLLYGGLVQQERGFRGILPADVTRSQKNAEAFHSFHGQVGERHSFHVPTLDLPRLTLVRCSAQHIRTIFMPVGGAATGPCSRRLAPNCYGAHGFPLIVIKHLCMVWHAYSIC